jgi:hypothetical protein
MEGVLWENSSANGNEFRSARANGVVICGKLSSLNPCSGARVKIRGEKKK